MRDQLLSLDHLVQTLDPPLYNHLKERDSTNFFFFFRMLLVWFKREFEWDDVLSLWERLWTDYLSGQFVIFFTMAVLWSQRNVSFMMTRSSHSQRPYANSFIFSGYIQSGGLWYYFETFQRSRRLSKTWKCSYLRRDYFPQIWAEGLQGQRSTAFPGAFICAAAIALPARKHNANRKRKPTTTLSNKHSDFD